MDEKRLHLDRKLNRELHGGRSRKTLLLVAATLILTVGVLASLAVLNVRARGPASEPVVVAMPVMNPSIRLAPAEGMPGTPIAITGEGWRQWDTVVLRLDGFSPERETQVPLGFAAVSREGSFTHSFVLPSGASWDGLPYVQVTAWSPATGDGALARLLMPGKPAATQPSAPTPTATLTLTPTESVPAPESAQPPPPTEEGCVDRASFVSDVTIPDNTRLSPGQSFVKTWRLQNSGSCTWSTDYVLVFVDGHRMGGPPSVPLRGTVAPGSTVDLSITLTAPAGDGAYEGKWQLRNTNGDLFGTGETAKGDSFWVRIAVSSPPPPAPLTITGWRGEYYGNRELRGEPALVRDDADVNFDWGRSASATSLPADDFSVRWVRTAEFDGTTYRFHVWADDGFRLWVDDRLILDAWWDGGLRERTMDYTPVRGTHHLRVEYYERTGEARIHAWWEKVASPSYPDWKGEYWPNRDLSGSPALVRNDPSLNFNWGWEAPAAGLPADSFSARWTRAVAFDAATYRFHVLVDDGARLWVDGHLIIDTWREGEIRKVTADRAMTGSLHDLRVEFYEYSGEARIHLWWESVE